MRQCNNISKVAEIRLRSNAVTITLQWIYRQATERTWREKYNVEDPDFPFGKNSQ